MSSHDVRDWEAIVRLVSRGNGVEIHEICLTVDAHLANRKAGFVFILDEPQVSTVVAAVIEAGAIESVLAALRCSKVSIVN